MPGAIAVLVAAGAIAAATIAWSAGSIAFPPLTQEAPPPTLAEIVPDQYIVVFKDDVGDVDAATSDAARRHGLSPQKTYRAALKGFVAVIPAARLQEVKDDPRVAFVNEDRLVHASATSSNQPVQGVPTGVQRLNAPANANTGAGIGVAVIDTGISLAHPDLSANIVANVNCVNSKKNGDDDNGHGTHVAGTIAALNNAIGVVGTAPGAKLAAVKVLSANGSGTWSQVICGIDWVTANAAKYNLKVANMSLGGVGANDNNCGLTNRDALHKAICRSRTAGVTYVVAAGNDGANAAATVPAAYDDAVITVSALADSDGKPGGLGAGTSYGPDDTFATFSNYGSVVDLGAPGVNILSTWLNGGYNKISGTSMATPHVSASAALYVKSHPGSTWTQVRDGLKAMAEPLNSGHTDPSGKHPEPIVKAGNL